VDLVAEFAKRWPNCTFEQARLADAPTLDGDHTDDVVLAWACAAGIPAALAELDANAIAPALAHVRTRGDADEIAQLARVRLLVGDPPAITTYRGRGSLAAFVRTIVVRLSLDQVRATRDVPSDELDALVDRVGADPELAHMRERYAGDLGAALKIAWRALAPHDRFVLDLELHQHLGIEQIANIYGIHRTNATRRIASARAAFVAGTREALRVKLGIGDGTLDSILRLMTTSTKWTALAAID
jgi:RNA polymerase sigma-70 factor (ECF subfamily)